VIAVIVKVALPLLISYAAGHIAGWLHHKKKSQETTKNVDGH
jgi:hypothetical protein